MTILFLREYLTGANLRFSRGKADFQKTFRKFCRPFFQVEQIDFPSSQKTLKLCFGQIFCTAGKILKKTGQERHF